jgi:CHAT domain-containing protein
MISSRFKIWLWLLVALGGDSGTAMAEPPTKTVPLVLEPHAQARREATFLLGDGDRLRQAGRWKEARKTWLAAAEAYQRAEDPVGVSEAYRRLGDSFTQGSDPNKGDHRIFLDYYVKGMSAAVDAFEASTGKGQVRDEQALVQADALLDQAARLAKPERCAQAQATLREAERLYERAGFAVGEVRAVLRRVPCLAGSDRELMATLTIAAGMLEALPQSSRDPKLAADALFHRGRWREAREADEERLCRAEQAKDLSGIAAALVDLGIVQAAQGDLDEAEVSLQRSLGLLPFLDGKADRNLEGLARESLGRVFLEGGRLNEGVEEIQEAREVWQRSGQPDRDAVSLSRLAAGLSDNGELVAALAAVHDAEELRRRLPDDPESEGDLQKVKASILRAQGKFQEALGSLYKAEDCYRRGRLSLELAAVAYQIQNLQDALGRPLGEEVSQEAPTPGSTDPSRLIGQLEDLQRFQALDQSGKHQEAIEVCRRMIRSSMEAGNRELEGMARGLLALSYLEIGQREEASQELARASLLVPPGGNPPSPTQELFAQIQTVVKAILEMQGPQGAPQQESGLREDIQSLERSGSGENRDLFLHLLKSLERMQSGDPEGTFREISETIAFFNERGKRLTLSELKAPFFDRQFQMYSAGVEVSLATGRPEAAFRYAEEARARAFADQIGNQRIDERRGADPELLREERRLRLQLASLKKALRAEQERSLTDQSPERSTSLQRALDKAGRDYDELRLRLKATSPEYAALVGVDPVDLPEIQRQVLDDRTTLIEYFLPFDSAGLANRVLAFVIDQGHFTMVPLPVTTGELKNRIVELRNLIAAQQPVTSQAAALYRDLIAPLAPHIRHHDLVIVPHGLLHFLPFAALWDEKEQRYLGDAYTLSYSPSATVLKLAREKKARAVAPALVLGNPDGSLPQAGAEAQAIARLYGTKPLLGWDATEGAVVAQAEHAGILHLAAHAVLNPVNPLFTRIELAADAEHDGSLEAGEIFGLDLSRTGLVVLSACSTQLGKLSTGDELDSLTRAFLYAGTPAVVSSLWNVTDDSTAILMERFYTHLRQGVGRAEALRQAQMEARRLFPHPYHWAAFVLTGDGR